MTRRVEKMLESLSGTRRRALNASVDDLQGLLLQVVFALLMVFIIAYFIFVGEQKRSREEEILELNRQKLVLAIEKISERYRVKYALNSVMVQSADGRPDFDPNWFFKKGKIQFPQAVKKAFSKGSRTAYSDYADPIVLMQSWKNAVLSEAGIETPSESDNAWLNETLEQAIEAVRLDVRGVQRAIAAAQQRRWATDYAAFNDVEDPERIAEMLKVKSLKAVSQSLDTELLP
jgi:hypothetical protein